MEDLFGLGGGECPIHMECKRPDTHDLPDLDPKTKCKRCGKLVERIVDEAVLGRSNES